MNRSCLNLLQREITRNEFQYYEKGVERYQGFVTCKQGPLVRGSVGSPRLKLHERHPSLNQWPVKGKAFKPIVVLPIYVICFLRSKGDFTYTLYHSFRYNLLLKICLHLCLLVLLHEKREAVRNLLNQRRAKKTYSIDDIPIYKVCRQLMMLRLQLSNPLDKGEFQAQEVNSTGGDLS